MNYTKGEWNLELRPANNVHRIRTDREIIADVFGTNAEDKANAHLIVAAPDMYEALKWLCEDINNKEAIVSRVSTRTKIINALSKAEGE